MDSLDEFKDHQSMKRGKMDKWVRGKVKSSDKLQEELIKGGRG
jgi:hypothetical protein